jgi:hypothetical protein
MLIGTQLLCRLMGLVFTFGARGIALWLAHMVDRAEEKRLKIIAGEIAR